MQLDEGNRHDRSVDTLGREAVITRDAYGVLAHGAASVRREPLLGLGHGAHQAGDVRRCRRP
jgi:hypothetical protein